MPIEKDSKAESGGLRFMEKGRRLTRYPAGGFLANSFELLVRTTGSHGFAGGNGKIPLNSRGGAKLVRLNTNRPVRGDAAI